MMRTRPGATINSLLYPTAFRSNRTHQGTARDGTCRVGALNKLNLKQKRTSLPFVGWILENSVEVRVPALVA